MHKAPPVSYAELFVNLFPVICSGEVEFEKNPEVHENPALFRKVELLRVTELYIKNRIPSRKLP